MDPVGTEHLPLFAPPRAAARRTDPETSHIAARQFRAGSHYAQILAALDCKGREGATHRELARLTRLDPVQIDRRLPELRRRGHVVRLETTRGAPPAHVYVRRRFLEGAD